jgi:hypothetical protein
MINSYVDRNNLKSISRLYRNAVVDFRAPKFSITGAPGLVLLSFYPMSDMSHLAANSPVDLEQLRIRLRKMSGEELLRFGQAARYMCTPQANIGKPASAPKSGGGLFC